MDMPHTFLMVQEQFTRYAKDKRVDAEASLSAITQWREQTIDQLHQVTMEFLLTGIVDLPHDMVRHYGGPQVFRQRSSGFEWPRYVRELAKNQSRPFVYIFRQSPAASCCATVVIQKQKYTLDLTARFLLLEKRYIMGDTRRWNFLIPRDYSEMIQNWRADCATDPVLRRALRLAPEYRPTL